MIFGHNTNVSVGTVKYHVQTEDAGTDSALIDTTVYCGGRVLHRRTNNYHDLLPLNADRQEALKLRLDEQHRQVLEEIRSGILYLPAPTPRIAAPPSSASSTPPAPGLNANPSVASSSPAPAPAGSAPAVSTVASTTDSEAAAITEVSDDFAASADASPATAANSTSPDAATLPFDDINAAPPVASVPSLALPSENASEDAEADVKPPVASSALERNSADLINSSVPALPAKKQSATQRLESLTDSDVAENEVPVQRSVTLSLELVNAKTWLAGRRATLHLRVTDPAGRVVPDAYITAAVSGAADPAEFYAETGDNGEAHLAFDMPRLADANASLLIEASHVLAHGFLRFQLRARQRVPVT